MTQKQRDQRLTVPQLILAFKNKAVCSYTYQRAGQLLAEMRERDELDRRLLDQVRIAFWHVKLDEPTAVDELNDALAKLILSLVNQSK